ncbi:MAG TPA: hypothetical protein VN578_21445 [Candidatus Binatia bacterium]|jgi:hypothetical protein|nr:hypothetical protein [Candidatus Binatia bacterium]
MKRLLLILGLSANIPGVATSQISLNTGDSFTFEFTHFDFQAHGLTGPSARVGLSFQGFVGTDTLQFNAFEDSPAQPPIFSTTLTASMGSPDFTFGPAWQDLQGAFSVTMLSGSTTLLEFFGSVITASGDLYSLKVIPVPEPSPFELLAVGGLALLIWYRHRPQISTSAGRAFCVSRL